MLIAVNYHYIKEHYNFPYPSIFGVTPQGFSDQLDMLGKSAVFLSAADIVEIIDGKKPLPSRSVVITFDDGFREQYHLAWPILKRKEIPAIFFINTKPIEEAIVTTTHKIHIIRAFTSPDKVITLLKDILGKEKIIKIFPDTGFARSVYRYDTPENAQLKYFLNHVLEEHEQKRVIDQCFQILGFDETQISKELYMSKDMIKHLAEEGALGTHGHSHHPLGLLKEDKAIEDIDISLNRIREWTGHPIESLSYPFGFKEACSEVVAEYAQKKGVKFAFTMERAGNLVMDAPMFLSRFSSSDVPGGNNCKKNDHFWNEIAHATWFRNGRKL